MNEQEQKELERDKIYTCSICGDYQGTKAQLRGHEPRCKRKTVEIDVEPETIEEPEPITETVSQTPERRERIPFGVKVRKLKAPTIPGFEQRYFNDNWRKDPDRIQRAELGGWTRVEGRKAVPVGTNDDGSAILGVLMKIPKELYDEDQREKQKVPDRIDEAINRGMMEQRPGDNRYIPDGIKIYADQNEPK